MLKLMLFCRIAGIGILAFCCFGIGHRRAEKGKDRRKATQDSCMLLSLLKENLRFPKEPVLTFLNRCAENTLWAAVHPQKITTAAESLYEKSVLLWLQLAGFSDMLPANELASLQKVLTGIGKDTAETDEKNLEIQIRAREHLAEELLGKEKAESRLYHALGCLSGLMLALLLL